jgi:hypothetical protein
MIDLNPHYFCLGLEYSHAQDLKYASSRFVNSSTIVE